MESAAQRPKQAAKPRTTPSSLEEGAIRVHALHFRGGVDTPTEQQVMRISEKPRTGRPTYRIVFLPRIDKYLVRSFEHGRDEPDHTFMVPADWAIAEFAEQ